MRFWTAGVDQIAAGRWLRMSVKSSAEADGARPQGYVGCLLWGEMAFGGNELEADVGGVHSQLPLLGQSGQWRSTPTWSAM